MAVELELKVKTKNETSPWLEFWKQFRRNRIAMVGLIILLFLFLMAVFAPFIAPYDYRASNLPISLQPPSLAHWFGTDELGRDILSR
ncbi:MAG TPA: peptide ABC transporter permease, partial [Firmicutes bacterium]|nr:peptide ABC transporter permease [Bacillota bacterium]